MVNVELLKREIADLGVPKTVIAEKCAMTRQSLDNKLEKPHTITADEAYEMAAALRITEPKKLLAIFFAPKVEPDTNREG